MPFETRPKIDLMAAPPANVDATFEYVEVTWNQRTGENAYNLLEELNELGEVGWGVVHIYHHETTNGRESFRALLSRKTAV